MPPWWTPKLDIFSFEAIRDKLINFYPSYNVPELVYKIRGRRLGTELVSFLATFISQIMFCDWA